MTAPSAATGAETHITTAATEESTSSSRGDDSKVQKQRMIGDYTEDFLLERAQALVKQRTANWEIAIENEEDRFPRFHRTEIKLGQVFGKGGFFVVSEVHSLSLEKSDKEESQEKESEEMPVMDQEIEDYIQAVVQDRGFMAKHCVRQGHDCRYALKTMQDACRSDPSTFVSTLVDMSLEARFLSSIRHPNIIKMRAMSYGDVCHPKAFLILDRLYDTLKDRIVQWKRKDENRFLKMFDFQQKREKMFLAKRLIVAYDVASAIEYLHNLNIMYRDLKSDNIGFDVRGDAKLFDFGLAVEFGQDKTQGGTYQLTGDTGTIRYMAPEVTQSQPYTETADVYSFGVLLWEICKMEQPYASVADDVIERKVAYCGLRPKVEPKWPAPVRQLLEDCFASSPRRPSMDTICKVLRQEINELACTNELKSNVREFSRLDNKQPTYRRKGALNVVTGAAMVCALVLYWLGARSYRSTY